MSNYKFGEVSLARLIGVHPDLIRVVKDAILHTPVDIVILEGKRTLARQRILFAKGASGTLNSRHLTGHAVDLGAWVDSQVDWSWPLYRQIAKTMKDSAARLGIPVEWGGDWSKLKDGPHYQLPWALYAVKKTR